VDTIYKKIKLFLKNVLTNQKRCANIKKLRLRSEVLKSFLKKFKKVLDKSKSGVV